MTATYTRSGLAGIFPELLDLAIVNSQDKLSEFLRLAFIAIEDNNPNLLNYLLSKRYTYGLTNQVVDSVIYRFAKGNSLFNVVKADQDVPKSVFDNIASQLPNYKDKILTPQVVTPVLKSPVTQQNDLQTKIQNAKLNFDQWIPKRSVGVFVLMMPSIVMY